MSYSELDNNMNIINNIQLTENFAWYNRFLTFLNFLRTFPYLFLDLVIFLFKKNANKNKFSFTNKMLEITISKN